MLYKGVTRQKILQEKAVEATKQSKKEKIKNLSMRNMKACHSVSTALLQSVVQIGTQSTMKSNKRTLHEITSKIPPKTPERSISSTTNKMMHTDITFRAQGSRVINTHATESTNCHQNSQAIK
jgi:hypothetical protein